MWEWYRIGLAAGLGVSIGLLLAGLLAASRAWILAAIAVAAAAGAGMGLVLDDWTEAVAGGLGGFLGAGGAATIVGGTLRRGGTRGGTAVLVTLGALVAAGLALVPGLGYLEALIPPALALRARRRAGDRYAGLRTLARD
ncbi:MAG: hypothetical protein M3R26_00775 [Actinomycetota bacterium]|nr:hypothetical protein [Actinomycetota bacterium]MDQ2983016.1 hypothetical protein [Actinomycetota bacterium]